LDNSKENFVYLKNGMRSFEAHPWCEKEEGGEESPSKYSSGGQPNFGRSTEVHKGIEEDRKIG
jgi:hypothetical protein